MTPKQQIATGFLAALIIGSVAFMPVNADSSVSGRSGAKHASPVVATKTDAAPARNEPPRNLTYN